MSDFNEALSWDETKQLPIRLRAANEEDVPLIFSSWLKSYRSSTSCRGVINTVYFSEQHKLIEKILKTANVIMAVNKDDPSQVYGWICAGRVDNIFCLHFVYVKHSFRNMGISRLLFNAFDHDKDVAGIYTHNTKAMELLSKRYNLVYHPYILTNDYLKVIKE